MGTESNITTRRLADQAVAWVREMAEECPEESRKRFF